MKSIFLRPRGVLFAALLLMTFVISGVPALFAGSAGSGAITRGMESVAGIQPTKWVYSLHEQGDLDLASPVLADMNGNGTLDVIVATHDGRIAVIEGDSSGTVTTPIWEKDFSSAFGMSPGTQEFASSPAVADIDQDGLPEIVIGAGSTDSNKCTQGGVIVIEHNGNVKAGWPKLANDFNNDGCKDTIFATPALGDLTGDGYLEIIAGGFDKRIYAWRYDGTSLPGFPADSYLLARFGWANLNNQLADTIWSSPALADLNADGYPEILIGSDEGNFDDTFPNGVGWVCPYAPPPGAPSGYCGGSLYGLDRHGNSIPGFPEYILEHIQSTPAIADVNHDGNMDIFVGTGTYYNRNSPSHPTNGFRLFGFDKNGNDLPGWGGGKQTTGTTPASPVIGDIAGDSSPEILITTMDKKLYAWHADGTPVAGFPMTPIDQAGSSWSYDVGHSLLLADYDGDGKQEIFLSTAWSVSIVDGNGQMLTSVNNGSDGKPIYYAYHTLRNNPAIGDLDNDGKLELVAMNYAVHVWELADSLPDADWPMYKRDAARTSTVEEATLALTTEAITVMQELGVGGTIPYTILVRNVGPGTFEWMATPNDARVTAVPNSGTASRNNPDSTTIHINTTGLSLGTHSLGSVSIAATIGGQPVASSPTAVSVTVIVVEDLYEAFLPLVVK